MVLPSKEDMLVVLRAAIEAVENGNVQEIFVVGIELNGDIHKGFAGYENHFAVASQLLVNRNLRGGEHNL